MEPAVGGPTPLVAAYWRTNLILRQRAPLFRISKRAADRSTMAAPSRESVKVLEQPPE